MHGMKSRLGKHARLVAGRDDTSYQALALAQHASCRLVLYLFRAVQAFRIPYFNWLVLYISLVSGNKIRTVEHWREQARTVSRQIETLEVCMVCLVDVSLIGRIILVTFCFYCIRQH